MKSMFDSWHGGKLSSRQQMAEKIKTMQTVGSVIEETFAAVQSRTAADEVEGRAKFNQERKWHIVKNEESAPFCGERY